GSGGETAADTAESYRRASAATAPVLYERAAADSEDAAWCPARLSAGSSGETRRGCPADTPEPGGRPAGVVPAWGGPEADGGAAWCPGRLVAGAAGGAGAGSVGRPSRVALAPGVESDADRLSAGPDPWVGEDADWLPAGVVPDSGV